MTVWEQITNPKSAHTLRIRNQFAEEGIERTPAEIARMPREIVADFREWATLNGRDFRCFTDAEVYDSILEDARRRLEEKGDDPNTEERT